VLDEDDPQRKYKRNEVFWACDLFGWWKVEEKK